MRRGFLIKIDQIMRDEKNTNSFSTHMNFSAAESSDMKRAEEGTRSASASTAFFMIYLFIFFHFFSWENVCEREPSTLINRREGH